MGDTGPDGQSKRFDDVDQLLEHARAGLVRLTPAQAAAEVGRGALFVDIRPAWQRAAEGELAGSLIVERNHLEWRLHPGSGSRHSAATSGQRWVVVCSKGYTSSLAAAVLCSLGVPASDLIGGVQGWRAAGLPVVPGPTRDEQFSGVGTAVDFGDLGGPHIEDEAPH